MPLLGTPSFSAHPSKGRRTLPTHPTSRGEILLPGRDSRLQTDEKCRNWRGGPAPGEAAENQCGQASPTPAAEHSAHGTLTVQPSSRWGAQDNFSKFRDWRGEGRGASHSPEDQEGCGQRSCSLWGCQAPILQGGVELSGILPECTVGIITLQSTVAGRSSGRDASACLWLGERWSWGGQSLLQVLLRFIYEVNVRSVISEARGSLQYPSRSSPLAPL